MDSYQPLDWSSQKSQLFLNPRLSEIERSDLEAIFKRHFLPHHIFVASSGSSQKVGESLKLIALSYSAFLSSAEAVNKHIQVNVRDKWLQPLPQFHVGGLSIYARAFLSNSKVVEFPQWSSAKSKELGKERSLDLFFQVCDSEQITLTSLVPTQLFDLVQLNRNPPPSLRALVIGGGKLPEDLYRKSRDLGWPILPSYGMTEMSSQIATAGLSSLESGRPDLEILPHVKLRTDPEGFLEIQSQALLSGFGQWIQGELQWTSVSTDHWFKTSDLAEIVGNHLIPKGRKSHFIKVLGEGVDLSFVQEKFDAFCGSIDRRLLSFYQLSSNEDSRQGQIISLQILEPISEEDFRLIQSQIEKWNQMANPVERIQKIVRIQSLNWKRS